MVEGMLLAPRTPMAKRREAMRGNSPTNASCRTWLDLATHVAWINRKARKRLLSFPLLVCPCPFDRLIDRHGYLYAPVASINSA